MKKLFILISILSIIFTLTACGSQNSSNANGSPKPSASPSFPENQPSETQNAANKKALVVYYSATENTKKIAEYIADAVNGDIFMLEPLHPYSENDLDWTDENSRVVKEHNDPNARNVPLAAAAVDNWSEYDTVFIGYPIWWGIAAWPINGFIEANNFTGKTVIPFCTSASSGLGQSAELLKEAAGTGNWLEGKRFSSGAPESEVRKWLETLTP